MRMSCAPLRLNQASSQFISLRPQTFRETTSPRNDYVSQDQSIHFCPEETIQGFLRLADHGLILIERCVEYHRYARENAKVFDQPVISWVGKARHSLEAARAIHVGNGGNQLSLFFANLEDLHHEWNGVVLLEPLGNGVLHHRRGKRAE